MKWINDGITIGMIGLFHTIECEDYATVLQDVEEDFNVGKRKLSGYYTLDENEPFSVYSALKEYLYSIFDDSEIFIAVDYDEQAREIEIAMGIDIEKMPPEHTLEQFRQYIINTINDGVDLHEELEDEVDFYIIDREVEENYN